MSLLCPKDYKYCLDDMCRGSLTCMITQDEMIELCPSCKQEVRECECPCLGCGQVVCCCDYDEV